MAVTVRPLARLRTLWSHLPDRRTDFGSRARQTMEPGCRQPGLLVVCGAVAVMCGVQLSLSDLLSDLPPRPTFVEAFVYVTRERIAFPLAELATCAILLGVLRWLYATSVLRELRREWYEWPSGLAVGLALGSVVGAIQYSLIWTVSPERFGQWGSTGSAWRHPAYIALALLTMAVVAPTFEELLTRRVLYRSLRQRLPWFAAAILTSALFALAHGADANAAAVFLGSLILTAVYERTRSLIFCVATHGASNLSLVAVRFILDPPWS